MGSLYIGGAQCIHAQFMDEDDWQEFDSQKQDMSKLAEKFNVHISRYSLDDDGPYSYVVMNKKVKHECFYEGAAFEVDMRVETSDTFEDRAHDFIKALNQSEEFKIFHSLSWSKPKVLYFVVS